jgi:hypothetical protein
LAVSGVSVAAAAGRLLQPGRRAAKWQNANAPTRPVEAGRQSPASPTATALPWANCFVFTCTRKPPTATDQLTTNQLTNQPTNGKAYYHSRLDSTRDHSTQLPGDEAFYLALSRSCGQFDRPSLGRSAREARPPAPNMHGEWVGDLGWVPAAADREAVQRARGQPHTTYLDLQPAAARLEPASWTQIARVSQSDWFPDMFCPRTGPAPQQQVTAPFGGIDCLLPRAGKQASKLWGGWRTLDRQAIRT